MEKLLSFAELCAISRREYPAISEGCLRQLVNRKIVPSRKIGGRLLFDESSFEELRAYAEHRSRAVELYRMGFASQLADIQNSVDRSILGGLDDLQARSRHKSEVRKARINQLSFFVNHKNLLDRAAAQKSLVPVGKVSQVALTKRKIEALSKGLK
jgi:hypothetical protein